MIIDNADNADSDSVTRDYCYRGPHGPVPCPWHASIAAEAAEAAAIAYRESRDHLPARDVARGAGGAATYAWQRALERPLTPCTDGSAGLGWPSQDEETWPSDEAENQSQDEAMIEKCPYSIGDGHRRAPGRYIVGVTVDANDDEACAAVVRSVKAAIGPEWAVGWTGDGAGTESDLEITFRPYREIRSVVDGEEIDGEAVRIGTQAYMAGMRVEVIDWSQWLTDDEQEALGGSRPRPCWAEIIAENTAYAWRTDAASGRIVAADIERAIEQLVEKREWPDADQVADGAWGWIEALDGSERVTVGKVP